MSRAPKSCRPATRGLVFLCIVAAAFFLIAALSLPRPSLADGGTPTPTPTPTPGPPVKIVFDPPDPSVRPGTQITITATALDKDNRQIEGGTYEFKLADEEHEKFVIHREKENKLVVSGLFAEKSASDDKQGRETISFVPFIVTFKKGGSEEIRRVLNVSLNDAVRPPGPVPPGLKPQVDVMWDVLPRDVVLANFGRKVRGDYYGIQIVIGNNSGYDLQIASAGFRLKNQTPSPSGATYPLPTASYQLARGSIAREQEIGAHARLVNSLDAFGPLLTGFVPFFHVLPHRANFAQGVNVFSNPFAAGTKLLFPDTVVGQLGRLEQQTFRNDQTTRTIIPNNTQVSIVTFFPKMTLREYMRTRLGYQKKADFENPTNVMEALGDLVLIGQQVAYLNRVHLVGDETRRDTASISGRVLDGCNNGVADVKLTLAGGPFFKGAEATTKADGTYLFQGIPTGDDYKVTAKKDPLTFVSEGGDSFRLEGDRTSVNFRVKEDTHSISGKVSDKSGAILPTTVTVTATGTSNPAIVKSATTNEQGEYVIAGLPPDTYSLKVEKISGFEFAEAGTLSSHPVIQCSQTGVNFTAKATTPATTPTPKPTP